VTTLHHPYLNLAAMETLRRVRLRPRGAAEGAFAGPHKSSYRGTAVEFADYREYTPGDDIRLVDWKVFARSDRHYIKLFDAERNLLTYLALDKSGSMGYSGLAAKTMPKLEYAARLAVALGYLVLREGDEVGLSLADSKVAEHLAPGASWQHLNRMLDALTACKPAGKTDLGACLERIYSRAKRRGVLIVISDFLGVSDSFWKSIDLFRRSKFDVILFQVLHPEELDLPEVNSARFIDSEGAPGYFNAEPGVIRQAYWERFATFLKQIEGGCRARGCDWFLAKTSDDPHAFLRNCFYSREILG
jgi:uncharacterized protein (DUF58 family)